MRITTLRGVLTSTRALAMRSTERGLLFAIDPATDVQTIYPIVSEPPADDETGVTEAMAVDRFTIVPGRVYTIAAPLRVAPISIVDGSVWTELDIDHGFYGQEAPDAGWPVHRNYFAVIFNTAGELQVERTVLIHDPDLKPTASPDDKGDRTGLPVNDADEYFDGPTSIPIDVVSGSSLPDMLVEVNVSGQAGTTALNFRSCVGVVAL